MTRQNTDSDGTASTTRRSLLRGVGTVALGVTAGIAGSASAAGPKVYVVTGSMNSPITEGEMDDIREKASSKVDIAKPRVKTEYSELDDPIVGFTYVVDDKGRSEQATTIAGDRGSVSDMRARANQAAKQISDGIKHGRTTTAEASGTSGSGSISTQSKSWTNIHSDTDYYKEQPYGEVGNGHDWYELEGDSYNNYTPFAVNHKHKTTPGKSLWDNEWTNFRAFCEHDWTLGDADYITDHGPTGTIDTSSGSVSKDISLRIDGETLTYTDWIQEDVEIKDQTTESTGIAEWQNTYFGKSTDDYGMFEPGSAVIVPDKDSSEKVVNLDSRQKYRYGSTGTFQELYYVYGLVYNF